MDKPEDPEAIMPLTRGPNGKLGVQASSAPATKVTHHIDWSTIVTIGVVALILILIATHL